MSWLIAEGIIGSWYWYTILGVVTVALIGYLVYSLRNTDDDDE